MAEFCLCSYSTRHEKPFTFTAGVGQVISGAVLYLMLCSYLPRVCPVGGLFRVLKFMYL